MKILRVASWLVASFWFASLIFLLVTIRTIGGEAGRFLMLMATISVFGIAIIESIRNRN